MQKKAAIGTVLVLVALVMMGISLVMPWYTNENTSSANDISISIRLNYHLDHASFETDFPDVPGYSFNGTDDIDYDDETISEMNFVKTFQTTSMLVILGLIGCVLGLIGAALVALGKMKRSIGAILVLIAVIMCLLSPLYLMVSLIPAFEDDGMIMTSDDPTGFFGSEKSIEDGVTIEHNWGGAIGWFLPIIAAIICIIALIMVALTKPEPQAFSIEGPIAPLMAPADQIPSFSIEPEPPGAIPMAQPVMETKPKGEEFQCPQCSKVFIVALEKRPLHIKCPYCGLEGIVE